MNTIKLNLPNNLIGVFASGLCLIHCLATPFLFAAQANIFASGSSKPEWWGTLDTIFLVISLFAVWRSGKTTTKSWVRISLWVSWVLLAVVILNEKMSWFPLMEEAIYLPTISLIVIHLYNRKYCQCEDEDCCAPQ